MSSFILWTLQKTRPWLHMAKEGPNNLALEQAANPYLDGKNWNQLSEFRSNACSVTVKKGPQTTRRSKTTLLPMHFQLYWFKMHIKFTHTCYTINPQCLNMSCSGQLTQACNYKFVDEPMHNNTYTGKCNWMKVAN